MDATAPEQGRRRLLLGLVGLRLAVGVVAVPLAPLLYREHAAVLALLRPSKEVLLFAGFLVQDGRVGLLTVIVAALPLLLGGVWAMFALGRAYQDDVGEERSGWAGRLLPADKVQSLVDAIEARGMLLVFLGRLAAFPSTLVGAAAGASGVPWRRFLLADTAGALLSLAVLLAVGFALDDAHDAAGPWLTAAGVVVLAAGALVLGRALRSGGRTR